MIQITTGDARPIFRQIVDGLKLEIASGRLAPGAKLPSVRGLALQLTVNPNTVAKAYGELTSEGLIESRPGVGVFVSEPRYLLSDEERSTRLDGAVRDLVAAVIPLGYSTTEIVDRVEESLEPLSFERGQIRPTTKDSKDELSH